MLRVIMAHSPDRLIGVLITQWKMHASKNHVVFVGILIRSSTRVKTRASDAENGPVYVVQLGICPKSDVRGETALTNMCMNL